MIAVLLLFIGYQVYRIVLDPGSAGLIALTVFDIVIVALTWREYQQQRRNRDAGRAAAAADSAPEARGAGR
jgi:uncharacterized membrane protein